MSSRLIKVRKMSGILYRAVAQTVMFTVNVVSKAFMQAYSKAQAGGGQAAKAAVSGSRMPIDQARQILNLEKAFTREELVTQFDKYYKANDPDNGGSFYIQSKVFQARETLVNDLRRQAEAKSASKESEQKSEMR